VISHVQVTAASSSLLIRLIFIFRSLGVNLSDYEVLSQGWRRDAKVVGSYASLVRNEWKERAAGRSREVKFNSVKGALCA